LAGVAEGTVGVGVGVGVGVVGSVAVEDGGRVVGLVPACSES